MVSDGVTAMTNYDLKERIFKLIPKQYTAPCSTLTAWVEFADLAMITDKLEQYDIVITLRLYGRVDTPKLMNNIIAVDLGEEDDPITVKRGKRVRQTLSIAVHSKGTPNASASDIVEYCIISLHVWVMQVLAKVVEVEGVIGEQDFTMLEDGTGRKVLDVAIRDIVSYTESETPIGEIVAPIVKEDES